MQAETPKIFPHKPLWHALGDGVPPCDFLSSCSDTVLLTMNLPPVGCYAPPPPPDLVSSDTCALQSNEMYRFSIATPSSGCTGGFS